ncbi:MAG: stage V sporulation protein AD, partial [Oscillospiraceae bacterium]|nr:stage V sporulation protein AD [Oscillospiraceae bacterium]
AVLMGAHGAAPYVRTVTTGTIEDMGVTDINNMGAAMAPAAAHTIQRFFDETGTGPDHYDMIFTGDLAAIGSELMHGLLGRENIDIRGKHTDCGLLIYDSERQDVKAGGSGCGCSAVVLCAHIIPAMREGKLNNILFCATGALMSPLSIQQGESIPGIAHLIHLSNQ